MSGALIDDVAGSSDALSVVALANGPVSIGTADYAPGDEETDVLWFRLEASGPTDIRYFDAPSGPRFTGIRAVRTSMNSLAQQVIAAESTTSLTERAHGSGGATSLATRLGDGSEVFVWRPGLSNVTHLFSTVPSGSVSLLGIQMDSMGGVVVVGAYHHELRIGTISGATDYGAGRNCGVYVARILVATQAADWVWTTGCGGSSTSPVLRADVAIDPARNTYVGWLLDGAVTVDDRTFVGGGSFPVVLTSFSSTGTVRWSSELRTAGSSEEFGVDLVTLDAERLYVVFGSSAGADFGAGPLREGALVAEIGLGGAIENVISVPGTDASATPRSLGVTTDGRLLLAGPFLNTADLGSGSISGSSFVAEYSPELELDWARAHDLQSLGGSAQQVVSTLRGVWVAAALAGSTAIDGVSIEPTRTPASALVRLSR